MLALAQILPARPARPTDFPAAWRDLAPLNDPVSSRSAAALIEIVARCTAIPAAHIKGISRSREVVKARHIALWLCRSRLGWSYKRIGDAVGPHDHTTAIFAFRKVERIVAALCLPVDPDAVVAVHTLWRAAWPDKFPRRRPR